MTDVLVRRKAAPGPSVTGPAAFIRELVSGDGKVWQGPNQVLLAHRLAVICLVGFSCSHGCLLKLFSIYTEIRKKCGKEASEPKIEPAVFAHLIITGKHLSSFRIQPALLL